MTRLAMNTVVFGSPPAAPSPMQPVMFSSASAPIMGAAGLGAATPFAAEGPYGSATQLGRLDAGAYGATFAHRSYSMPMMSPQHTQQQQQYGALPRRESAPFRQAASANMLQPAGGLSRFAPGSREGVSAH
jgi:hypothetical protein